MLVISTAVLKAAQPEELHTSQDLREPYTVQVQIGTTVTKAVAGTMHATAPGNACRTKAYDCLLNHVS